MTGEHIDIDPMLFLGLVIEDQVDLLDSLLGPEMGDMGAIAGMFDGVADVAREKIAEAQVVLDKMIEADTTWRPYEVKIAEHFHPGEFYGCYEDHRKDHKP